MCSKISSQGDFEWAKTVGDAVGNTPYDIEWQSNNQIIWVGSSYSSETGAGSLGPVKFAIFDHSGELITEAITSIQNSSIITRIIYICILMVTLYR